VDYLYARFDARLNDSARLAWDGFKERGACLPGALETSDGAQGLLALGHSPDIQFAAGTDRFQLVPELRRNPLRVVAGPSEASS
jgi:hypothetical protein